MSEMEARRAELYADVAAHAAATARELGMASDQAEHLGAAVADALAENWRGQTLSFPIDTAYRLSQREIQILTAHQGGASVSRLAREHKMTEAGLRKLLRRATMRWGQTPQPEPDPAEQINLFDQAS